MNAPEKKYVTLPQAAEQLDVAVVTIRSWIAQGKIEAYRMGPRKIRVSQASLDAMFVKIPTA